MRTIDQHRSDLAALLADPLGSERLGSELVPLDLLADGQTAGHGYRIVAADVRSPVDLPRFDNSQMDGFALRSAESGGPLRVVAAIAAGATPPPLAPGSAAPIMTGAPMPEGADAVVAIEDVGPDRFPAALELSTINPPRVAAGLFVRAAGSDLRSGEVIARAGQPLTPALLGALAAAAVRDVPVVRRPRVLIVSTGSELEEGPRSGSGPAATDPDDGRRRAVIGDANGVSLRAAFAEVGAAARSESVADDPAALLDLLHRQLDDPADLVITTGGISMGAFEVVREALEPLGLQVTTVAMQPGGPQAWGIVQMDGAGIPVVAFPGNPVSALISFEMFLRPVFAGLAGLDPERPVVEAAGEPADSPAGKHQVRRATVVDGRIRFTGGASSHLIARYAEATHLVHIPLGTSRVEDGDVLTTWRIR